MALLTLTALKDATYHTATIGVMISSPQIPVRARYCKIGKKRDIGEPKRSSQVNKNQPQEDGKAQSAPNDPKTLRIM